MEKITVSKFTEALGFGSLHRKDTSLLTQPRFWHYITVYIGERCVSPEDVEFSMELLAKPISVIMDDPLFILISGEDNPMDREVFSITTEHSWGWTEPAELEIYSALKKSSNLGMLFPPAALEMIGQLDQDWEFERKKASEMKQLKTLAERYAYELQPLQPIDEPTV